MIVRWPRLLTPTHLIQIIRNQKNPLTALQIFNQARSKFPKYRHNGPVYASMINILGKSGQILEMKEVISQMKEDSCECRGSVIANALKMYARAGLLDEAISLFRSIPEFNCVNWTESFNTLLRILVKESKTETAYRLFLENSRDWSVKSHVHSLNLLIEVLCQNNRSDLALQVFQEMSYQCCYPDRETYSILMRGLCQDGRLNEATHLLYSMFWRISKKGSGEDVVVYKTLLDALCDHGEVQQAADILKKILRKGLKARSQSRKQLDLNWCQDGAEIQVAKVLIHEALVKGLVPSSGSYTALAVGLYSQGMITEADKVLHEMKSKGFRPSLAIYEAKLASLCREGRIDDAVKLMEVDLVEDSRVPTVQLYNILIDSLCKQRKSALAMKYLEKMSQWVGCVPDMDTYTILVDGLCHDGRFLEASKILQQMVSKSYFLNDAPYGKLIQGLCSMGRPYEAVLWLEEMASQGKMPGRQVWDSLVTSICYDTVDTDVPCAILEQLRR